MSSPSEVSTLTGLPRKKRIVKRPLRFQEDEHTTRTLKVERSSKRKWVNSTKQTLITMAKAVKKKAPHVPMWKVWELPSEKDKKKYLKQLEEDVNIIKASIAQRDKQKAEDSIRSCFFPHQVKCEDNELYCNTSMFHAKIELEKIRPF